MLGTDSTENFFSTSNRQDIVMLWQTKFYDIVLKQTFDIPWMTH